MKHTTPTELAELLGVSKYTTSNWAKRLGLGRREGRYVLLTLSEAKKIKRAIATAKVGNPNFGTGYRQGRGDG